MSIEQVGCWVLAVGLLVSLGGCVNETADDGGSGASAGGGSGGSGAVGAGASGGSGSGGSSGSASQGGAGATAGTEASGGSGGAGVGTPGCAPTVDCMKACGDYACIDECVARATPQGQSLFNTLGQCGTDAGCEDFYCTVDACPNEWDACSADFGENGYFCFAAGNYYVCDAPGSCEARAADGGSWGPTEEDAVILGVSDCTEHMANMIQVASITAYESGVVDSCVITQCSPQ